MPHREPMLLVDEATLEGTEVHSSYTVTGEEFFLKGHFPGFPVVPGVILCEIMAQCCAPLLGEEMKGQAPMYAGMNNVRFKKEVKPGDKIEVTGSITNRRGPAFFIKAKATVDGKLCCSGDLSFFLIPYEQ